MDQAEQKRLISGAPPWLLLYLVWLAFRLPYSYDMLCAEINDFKQIEEPMQVNLAVSKIDDVTELFPLIPPEPLPKNATMGQLEAWLEKVEQKQEQRHALLLDWLKDGACHRFRTTADRALGDITRAKYLNENQKGLLRQLVQLRRESLSQELEALGDDELLELVQREGRQPPPSVGKAEIIAYLLEVNEAQRTTLSSNWQKFESPVQTVQTKNPDRASVEIWRSRIELMLMKPFFLLDLGILFIPILGLLTVMLPRWRARIVERSFGLRNHTGEFLELDEIQAFVTKNAPRIEIRANLLHSGYAFVYARSYRRPRLAVLGGMYALWRSNPKAAREMLLHEIEHVRQGDHLVVGYGSFFSYYFKWLLVSLAILMAANLIISIVFSMGSIGIHPAHQMKLFGKSTFMALSSTATIFFMIMTKITTPLLGIWALELNADYGVSREQGLQLECDTKAMTVGVGRISQIIGTLTHPPLWLRTWLIKRNDWVRGLCRQMLFPVSFLIVILMFFFTVIFLKLATQTLSFETLDLLLGLCRESFESMYLAFGVMTALLLSWPWLSGYWERFFVGEGRLYKWGDGGRCISALLLGILTILAW